VTFAFALSADDIVLKADAGRLPPGSITFMSSVEDFENGSSVRETKYKVLNKGREKSLVETVFPERQAGRKLLMDDDNLWFYTPDIKRPARVSMQQKLTGEVANGDLARTNFSGDYDAVLAGKEKAGGKEAYKLHLKAKNSGVTYSKIDYWVGVKDNLPIKAVFYAVSGKVLKEAQYSDVKNVLGRKCVTKTTFTDFVDKGRKSVLKYSGHKRSKFSNATFSKESLSE
jgi:outer membrane lipoprotein-sorting protein